MRWVCLQQVTMVCGRSGVFHASALRLGHDSRSITSADRKAFAPPDQARFTLLRAHAGR